MKSSNCFIDTSVQKCWWEAKYLQTYLVVVLEMNANPAVGFKFEVPLGGGYELSCSVSPVGMGNRNLEGFSFPKTVEIALRDSGENKLVYRPEWGYDDVLCFYGEKHASEEKVALQIKKEIERLKVLIDSSQHKTEGNKASAKSTVAPENAVEEKVVSAAQEKPADEEKEKEVAAEMVASIEEKVVSKGMSPILRVIVDLLLALVIILLAAAAFRAYAASELPVEEEIIPIVTGKRGRKK
jgi:hypothetical protein